MKGEMKMKKFLFAIVTLMIAAFPTIGMAENKRITSLIVSLDDDGNLECSVSSFRGLDSFSNKEENIKVVNRWPATKSGYVHMWLTFETGDLLFLNDVNGRVAKLLNGNAAEWAKSWLAATKISGRLISLAAIEGESPYVRRAYEFAIKVGKRGEISLASPVTFAPKGQDKY
jgi:hypothetical protein